jgi:hypothetical protein
MTKKRKSAFYLRDFVLIPCTITNVHVSLNTSPFVKYWSNVTDLYVSKTFFDVLCMQYILNYLFVISIFYILYLNMRIVSLKLELNLHTCKDDFDACPEFFISLLISSIFLKSSSTLDSSFIKRSYKLEPSLSLSFS